MRIRKTDTFPREFIEVGRRDLRIRILAGQVPVAHVVCKNKDNVRFTGGTPVVGGPLQGGHAPRNGKGHSPDTQCLKKLSTRANRYLHSYYSLPWANNQKPELFLYLSAQCLKHRQHILDGCITLYIVNRIEDKAVFSAKYPHPLGDLLPHFIGRAKG